MNNGYTQIDINGELIGLKFGLPSIGKIKEMSEGMDSSVETMATYGMAVILYCGYWNNCLIKQVIPKHNLQFFYDAIEDAFLEEEKIKPFKEVMDFFNESRFIKVDESKKKSQPEESGAGTKLSPSATENLASDPTIITE